MAITYHDFVLQYPPGLDLGDVDLGVFGGRVEHRPLPAGLPLIDVLQHLQDEERHSTWPCMVMPTPFEDVVLFSGEIVSEDKARRLREVVMFHRAPLPARVS